MSKVPPKQLVPKTDNLITSDLEELWESWLAQSEALTRKGFSDPHFHWK